MFPTMFAVTANEAKAICAAYDRGGELCAAVELRRYFPGVDLTNARRCARAIAGWTPPAMPLVPVTLLRPGKARRDE